VRGLVANSTSCSPQHQQVDYMDANHSITHSSRSLPESAQQQPTIYSKEEEEEQKSVSHNQQPPANRTLGMAERLFSKKKHTCFHCLWFWAFIIEMHKACALNYTYYIYNTQLTVVLLGDVVPILYYW
jgi:hypothetical protein